MRPRSQENRINLRFFARAAIIAAIYASLTIGLAFISYEANQIRVAEALTVLPFFYSEAIIGLFLGAALANLFSPFGLIDVIFGSLLTLIAAVFTYYVGRIFRPRLKSRSYVALTLFLAPLFPVLFNAFGVSYYLLRFGLLSGYTYWGVMLSILAGELVACYLMGGPILAVLVDRYRKTSEIP